jgi:hypothetical protein
MLRGHGEFVQHGEVTGFCFGGWDIADRLHQPPVVEPVDPFLHRELNSFERRPKSTPVDRFGFVKAIDGLYQCADVYRERQHADR